ncbi:MAG: hypothetical protein JWM05_489 [Acidimicrobiales bacterium]|nr:hypothetical protein [Acidimicrobiales bacterium]
MSAPVLAGIAAQGAPVRDGLPVSTTTRGSVLDPADADEPVGSRRRHLSLSGVVALALVLWGVAIGMQPLHDNSFLTHLATGRLILRSGHVPLSDPFSYTAHGTPWIVQSWGAEVIYAWIERVVGLHGIQLLLAASTAGLTAMIWRLTRPSGSLVARVLVAGLAIGAGSGQWVERPLMFGFAGFAALLLFVESEVDPRWLVPLMWVWVNTHGSFPLGLVLLAALALGRWFDHERPARELRLLGWATFGVALGAVNPIGPKLLLFPLEVLQRTEAFKAIVEWQPPTWHTWGQRFFAVQLALAVLLLLRRRRWRTAIPLAIFAASALTSARNVPVASLALIPGMAAGLAGMGAIDGEQRRRVHDLVAGVLVAVMALVVLSTLTRVPTNLQDYPTASVAWMRDHGMLGRDDRVVTRDFVGNYLEAKLGPDKVRTFIDDRVDMYPVPLVLDYLALVRGRSGWQPVLERYRATAVLWDRDSVLGRALERSKDWQVVHRDHDWLVAVPVRAA